MAKSQETWSKKEKEDKKKKKKKEKEAKKEERKAQGTKSFEDMIVYMDENGNFTSTPPDPTKRVAIREEDIEIGVPKNRVTVQADPNRKGTVTFFNDSKGYGFIKDSDSQDSVFVHLNGLIDQIKENNKVSFRIEMGHKGPNAVDVKLIH
ncbi:MAG: cold shock domain-containing protein [Bacteroidia bacterium]|nr:cold shock domain-containing protein [Bacteroidia bacterium]